jgi:PleD family two-component response regulator
MNDHMGKETDRYDIVIADDSLTSLQLLTDILEDRGYLVRPASNGLLALETVAARLPDLILLVEEAKQDGHFDWGKRRRASISAKERQSTAWALFFTAFTE